MVRMALLNGHLSSSCSRWLGSRPLTCSLHSLGRVLVVHKTSRLEHERAKNKELSYQELKEKVPLAHLCATACTVHCTTELVQS